MAERVTNEEQVQSILSGLVRLNGLNINESHWDELKEIDEAVWSLVYAIEDTND